MFPWTKVVQIPGHTPSAWTDDAFGDLITDQLRPLSNGYQSVNGARRSRHCSFFQFLNLPRRSYEETRAAETMSGEPIRWSV